jgi:hypothetical protein
MKSSVPSYRFAGGKISRIDPPEWFVKLPDTGDWLSMLSSAGATLLDDFGGDDGADTMSIYEAPRGGYYVEYWNPSECIAQFFIDDAADYVLFRATVVAPLVRLIMDAQRYHEEQAAKPKSPGSSAGAPH